MKAPRQTAIALPFPEGGRPTEFGEGELKRFLIARQSLQDECERNFLVMAAAVPFWAKFCPIPAEFAIDDPRATKYLDQLTLFQEQSVSYLRLQIDLPEEYEDLIKKQLEDPFHFLYLPNAIFLAHGLPENGGVVPDTDLGFLSLAFEDTPNKYIAVQTEVMHEVNQVARAINDSVVGQVMSEYGYRENQDTYEAAFLYMMHVHPRALVYGEPTDWLPHALKRVNAVTDERNRKNAMQMMVN